MNENPICGECLKSFKPVQLGLTLEMIAEWGSYYKIKADQYACPNCGKRIYYGYAKERLKEHWEPGYEQISVDVQVAV